MGRHIAEPLNARLLVAFVLEDAHATSRLLKKSLVSGVLA
jgi:hypothetical protein